MSESCAQVQDCMQLVNELGILFAQSITARMSFNTIAHDVQMHVEQIRPFAQLGV